MKLIPKLSLIISLYFLVIGQLSAQVIEVPFKSEIPTKTFLVAAPNSKATVLLFIGGDGVLNLQADGSTAKENPLIRSVNLWKKYGINAVLVDSPSDLGDARRGNTRNAPDYLERVTTVVNFYQKKYSLPVWAFGHSMGTVTVINLANRPDANNNVAGIISAGTHKGEVLSTTFMMPVLSVHHTNDGCAATPVVASENIIKGRQNNTKSQLVMIDGGVSEGIPCMGLAYHGFNKTEDKLVEAAAQFILSK